MKSKAAGGELAKLFCGLLSISGRSGYLTLFYPPSRSKHRSKPIWGTNSDNKPTAVPRRSVANGLMTAPSNIACSADTRRDLLPTSVPQKIKARLDVGDDGLLL